MDEKLKETISRYVEQHEEEAKALLLKLGAIPAPSRHEEKRAAFVRDWLIAKGAQKVYIDDAQNVLCEIGTQEHEDLAVFAAHTDIVFPDTETIPVAEKDGRLYAPGIGDDTACLVSLLMAAAYLLQEKPPLGTGVLIAANACEEGLGNCDGCKAIMRRYGSRIRTFCSFDTYLGRLISTAVGSYRYRVTVKTTGGHSWRDYGRTNAIAALAQIIEKLYAIPVPEGGKTTRNVGTIEGGTTVNSIAESASMLCEFRSDRKENLDFMQERFYALLGEADAQSDVRVQCEVIGVRPCSGAVDPDALAAYTAANEAVIRTFYDGPLDTQPGSTDANIPLSKGITANTIGTIAGRYSHTREEWIDLSSLPVGGRITLGCILERVLQR